MGRIHIGTSGWHYKHWKGTFYPEGIKDADQFNEYARYFSTVEINNSFYKLPAKKAFAQWRDSSPPGFVFSVKVSRFITHMRKLIPDTRSTRLFLSHADKLEDKLGPLLLQLPPQWKVNTGRLKDFQQSLPEGYRFTFEFRHPSWYTEDVYALLKEHGAAFCIYHLEHHLSPLEVTCDFVYVRLHGPGNKYQGSYTDAELKQWANKCLQWKKAKKDVYIYFDNDQAGYAAYNAQRLKQILV